MKAGGETPPEVDIRQLAMEKMNRVLGESRARQVAARILTETGLTLTTADDLYAFSDELAKLPGFEGAVGGMLRVEAVLRGASRGV